ncbi:RCC1 domain-containing protein [Streptomyces sp. NPDC046727]|uniref:RCC1 domain-containing protein n=1 Tax=Streptomyces sp. NPDC046727 TaxID=3155373 RepID=UPI0033D665C6
MTLTRATGSTDEAESSPSSAAILLASGWDEDQQISGIQKAAKDENLIDVCAGGALSVALTHDGRLLVGGRWRELMDDLLRAVDHVRITAVSLRHAHAMAVSDTGELFAGGANDHQECSGIVTAARHKKIATISTGYHHSLAVTDTGELLAAGDNSHSQVSGILAAAHGKEIASVHASLSGSFAITTDGELLYAGDSDPLVDAIRKNGGRFAAVAWSRSMLLGQMHDGALRVAAVEPRQDAEATLRKQLGGHTVTALAAGAGHVLAITDDHRLIGAGFDQDREVSGLTAAADGMRVTAISAGYYHSLALATRHPEPPTGHTVQATFSRTQHRDERLTLRLRRGTGTQATVPSDGQPVTFAALAGEPIEVTIAVAQHQPAPGALYLTYDPATNTTTLDANATQLPEHLSCTNPAPNCLTFTWDA